MSIDIRLIGGGGGGGAVTSVAGRTGAVTLTSADIGGLGTAAVLDVGTTASKVVQLDASARLPAVDGSQLTNLPSAPVTSVAGKTGAVTLTISDITDFEGLYTNIEYINDNVVDIQAGINAAASNAIVWVGPGSYAGSTLTLTDKDMLKLQGEGAQTGAAGIVELTSRGIAISGSSSTRNVVTGFQVEGSFTVTGTQGRHHIRNCQLLSGLAIDAVPNFMVVRDCEITGAVTISAATTGTIYFIGCTFTSATFTNSASASLVIVTQCTGFPAASVASVTPYGTVGLSTGAAVNFNSQIVLPYATSFTGRTGELNNNAGFITSAQAPVQSVAGKTGAVTLSASDISGLATVATTGAYSDLSGKPTLATVATSGAYADLSGTPSLATVATTGAYSDLSGKPTLGTAAALDVGTTALKVVQLDASAKLPAVDGSQLINLPGGSLALDDLTDVTITTPADNQVLKYQSGTWINGSVSGTFPTIQTVTTNTFLSALTANLIVRASNTISINLPAASSSTIGAFVIVKNNGTGTVTISRSGSDTIDGGLTAVISTQYESRTIYCVSSSAWEIY